MLKVLLLSLSRQYTVDGQYIPSLFIEPEVRHDKTSYHVVYSRRCSAHPFCGLVRGEGGDKGGGPGQSDKKKQKKKNSDNVCFSPQLILQKSNGNKWISPKKTIGGFIVTYFRFYK